ncbi:hypothetical protein TruAng_005645 [Truncatella angustata]|nr:hypothetical protein TruAng_005645 [Truncatella angustata]
MSFPSQNSNVNSSGGPPRAQPSIRSFFQPTAPKYAAPPSASPPTQLSSAASSSPPPPQRQPTPSQAQQIPPPPPAAPPLPLQATANGNRNGNDNDDSTGNGNPPPTPVPVPSLKPTHHPNITLSPILPSHLPSLKHLTARLLPVRYPESFYLPLNDPLSSGAFSRVLLWTDTPTPSNPSPTPAVIGGLVCRPQSTFQPRPGSAQDIISDALYIQSLVLQEPYRGLGLAARMLDEVCALASGDERFRSRTVCAHVWTENDEGWEWYKARGFQRVEPVIDGYYRQLRPSEAWIVRREIGAGAAENGRKSVLDAVKANGIGGKTRRENEHAGTTGAAPTPAVAGFTTPPPAPSAMSGPPISAAMRPAPPRAGMSFQQKGPENEWNDLPEDMVSISRSNTNGLSVPSSGANSGASSRSNSTVGRKKKDRKYAAAAFGN